MILVILASVTIFVTITICIVNILKETILMHLLISVDLNLNKMKTAHPKYLQKSIKWLKIHFNIKVIKFVLHIVIKYSDNISTKIC